MTDITRLAPRELTTLRGRIERVCVVFPDHVLPRGFPRERGRIGLESDGTGTSLLVDRLPYRGDDGEVAAWARAGQRHFSTLDDALRWYRDRLSDSGTTRQEDAATPRPEAIDAEVLVDVTEVVRLMDDREPLSAEELTTSISATVLAQHEPVSTLAALVSRHVSKAHPRRPASALLLGPTGVGKTQTAEAIAQIVRERAGYAERLRFDLAEFTEQHSVARLIGSPPGYVGYGDPSLASLLAADDRRVVLFDEIDKAHPIVLTTLVNVLDAGRLDSAQHGEVVASKAILLFTSNAVSAAAHGFATDDDAALRRTLIDTGLRPEVVGRFGAIVRFGALDGHGRALIAARSFAVIAADYGIELVHVDAGIIARAIDDVDQMRLGARGLEHYIDRQFGAVLARGATGPQALLLAADGEARLEAATHVPETPLE